MSIKSNFFAKFKEIEGFVFRFDTRIYLNEISSPNCNDVCIGSVVGKNPGSAKEEIKLDNGYSIINLDGDKLLPTTKNIVSKFNIKTPKERAYIQVLNLFYLCDKDLNKALNTYNLFKEDKKLLCTTETKDFPFVWYLWGVGNSSLNKMKDRFRDNIKTQRNFFFKKEKGNFEPIERIPRNDELAKHTQGLPYINNPTIKDYINNFNIS